MTGAMCLDLVRRTSAGVVEGKPCAGVGTGAVLRTMGKCAIVERLSAGVQGHRSDHASVNSSHWLMGEAMCRLLWRTASARAALWLTLVRSASPERPDMAERERENEVTRKLTNNRTSCVPQCYSWRSRRASERLSKHRFGSRESAQVRPTWRFRATFLPSQPKVGKMLTEVDQSSSIQYGEALARTHNFRIGWESVWLGRSAPVTGNLGWCVVDV